MNETILFIGLAILARAVVPIIMKYLTNKNKLLIISLASVIGLITAILVNWYYKISIVDEFKSINTKDKILIILLGVIGIYGTIYFVIGTLATSPNPIASYATINALTPVISFLLAYFFLKEQMTAKIWIALFLMGVSIYLIQT